ncbi:MAG TPA: carboxylating nicotinate-nucleotide diphosphorylase [candidate division Zixibacteria bacterium]|nr:carboxylating nicotinate-nucleotide diphosphorylase [candidate division Zixibacteria bacterium]
MAALDKSIFQLVRLALDEDIGPGDVTSLACLEPEMITARIVAKSVGVVSGILPARLAFELVDSANQFVPCLQDGSRFEPGDVLVTIEGLNRTVLTAERVALNFMAHLSGVATLTRRFVDKIEGYNCQILDTRKTMPGWRILEKQAVLHGGGHNHRYGLYDMILIKDNHIAAAGSIRAAVEQARSYLHSADFSRQFHTDPDTIEIEVEVVNEAQLREAVDTGIKRLLLDNQTPESLEVLVDVSREIDSAVKLEASGNVSLDNVAAIAATGVDYISIGALTHSAPVCDLSLKVVE